MSKAKEQEIEQRYKKRYQEALEKSKSIYSKSGQGVKSLLSEIFDELKEPDDLMKYRNICNEIISHIQEGPEYVEFLDKHIKIEIF